MTKSKWWQRQNDDTPQNYEIKMYNCDMKSLNIIMTLKNEIITKCVFNVFFITSNVS